MTSVITVRDLAKRYPIGERLRYQTLRETIVEKVRTPLRSLTRSGSAANAPDREEENEIWALHGVNLDVAQGEVLGIIGPNGAGKSTLLKILARVTRPTLGYAEINGRVGSLLEVGTGFHPELTGRENVYLSGAILGMRRREIERRFDEIVSFAEVERFIDTPVKHYSSGMYVRLAFAVAVHMDPQVLLADEVLAVGDGAFWQKSMDKMRELNAQGMTILLVTHHMWFVQTVCSRAILLDHGSVAAVGRPLSVIGRYQSGDVPEPANDAPPIAHDSQVLRLVLVPTGEWTSEHMATPDAGIRLEFSARIAGHSRVKCLVSVTSPDGFLYFSVYSDVVEPASDGLIAGEVSIEHLMLKGGEYELYFTVHSLREDAELLAETSIPFAVLERDSTNSKNASFWNHANWKFTAS